MPSLCHGYMSQEYLIVSCDGNGSAPVAAKRGPGGAAGRGDRGAKRRNVVLRNKYDPPKIVNYSETVLCPEGGTAIHLLLVCSLNSVRVLTC
jgi:hypothetical protein